jgi:hypothetical protein
MVFLTPPQGSVQHTVAMDSTVAGVLDEPSSQLTTLSGVAVQVRQSTYRLEPCPSYVACRAGRYGYLADRA